MSTASTRPGRVAGGCSREAISRRTHLRGGLDHPSITGRPPSAPADANDPKAAALRAAIERQWRERVRHWPAGKRRAWLEERATELLMRPVIHRRRARDCDRERRKLAERVPSSTWFGGSFDEGAPFPVPGMHLGAGNVTLELSRTTEGGAPVVDRFVGRRWTSSIALSVEDQMDTMTPLGAQYYQHPPSCSAMAIAVIRLNKAHESRGRRKRSRALRMYSFVVGGETRVGWT